MKHNDEEFLSLIPIIRKIINDKVWLNPYYTKDDLFSEAWIVYVNAKKQYQPNKGKSFKNYFLMKFKFRIKDLINKKILRWKNYEITGDNHINE